MERGQERPLKVACIGSGYVGGPTMAVFAQQCPMHTFTCIDVSLERIKAWNSDELPLFEPGLLDIVRQCRGRNLFYSNEALKHVGEADIIFVSVNTPQKTRGVGAGKAANLMYWEASARLIAEACKRPGSSVIVVEKSTVPVKTASAIAKVLGAAGAPGVRFEILSNPAFVAQGTTIQELLSPDRVLIGGRDTPEGNAAVQTLAGMYERWVPRERIICTGLWSAELSKLASNAFLAQRLSSINAISALCEETGADIRQVAQSVGADSRIGPRFLCASLGFGGSTLQKDIMSLVYLCEGLDLPQVAAYWEQVVKLNNWQKERFVRRIVSTMFNTVTGKRIGILGWAYKKDTIDTRESPAIDIARALVRDGARVAVYDPKVSSEQVQLDMTMPSADTWGWSPGSSCTALNMADVEADAYAACKDAHAVCVCTDWDEFAKLDFARIYSLMHKPPFVFDGRNVLDHAALRAMGFVVYGVGRPLDPFLTDLEPVLGPSAGHPFAPAQPGRQAAGEAFPGVIISPDEVAAAVASSRMRSGAGSLGQRDEPAGPLGLPSRLGRQTSGALLAAASAAGTGGPRSGGLGLSSGGSGVLRAGSSSSGGSGLHSLAQRTGSLGGGPSYAYVGDDDEDAAMRTSRTVAAGVGSLATAAAAAAVASTRIQTTPTSSGGAAASAVYSPSAVVAAAGVVGDSGEAGGPRTAAGVGSQGPHGMAPGSGAGGSRELAEQG